VYRNQEVYRLL